MLHHNTKTMLKIFTDGSKVDEKVSAAAVSSVAPNSPFSCRRRDHCSIYTAELQTILFALKQAYQTQERKFIIFSDSLSSLQALEKLKSDHPLLIHIQDILRKIEIDQKEVVCKWVPGHVGIHGNEAADDPYRRPGALLRPKILDCQIYTSSLAERMG